jgi:hypothetical protein
VRHYRFAHVDVAGGVMVCGDYAARSSPWETLRSYPRSVHGQCEQSGDFCLSLVGGARVRTLKRALEIVVAMERLAAAWM